MKTAMFLRMRMEGTPITTTLPDGARAIVEGVYTYRVNDEGRILALRAFWEADAITFEPPPT